MIELSKELLLELRLFNNIEDTEWKYKIDKNTLKVIYNITNYFEGNLFTINIYELTHKYKEWALKYDLDCNSGYDFGNELYNCRVFSQKQGTEIKYSLGDTEVEAIIKACEWIYKEINK